MRTIFSEGLRFYGGAIYLSIMQYLTPKTDLIEKKNKVQPAADNLMMTDRGYKTQINGIIPQILGRSSDTYLLLKNNK